MKPTGQGRSNRQGHKLATMCFISQDPRLVGAKFQSRYLRAKLRHNTLRCGSNKNHKSLSQLAHPAHYTSSRIYCSL
eukprot:4244299-Amphidinium_carterae.1